MNQFIRLTGAYRLLHAMCAVSGALNHGHLPVTLACADALRKRATGAAMMAPQHPVPGPRTFTEQPRAADPRRAVRGTVQGV